MVLQKTPLIASRVSLGQPLYKDGNAVDVNPIIATIVTKISSSNEHRVVTSNPGHPMHRKNEDRLPNLRLPEVRIGSEWWEPVKFGVL